MPIPADSLAGGPGAELTGRRAECDTLDRLVAAVRSGVSRALVVHGEPGVGKSALLEYLAGRARDLQVVRAAGVQSEMELAFAAVHQLCAPMLGHLERLPGPQRDPLRTVFGMSAGPAPDRFLVGRAVLSLLSDAGEKQPVICLVDDQQWLDQAGRGRSRSSGRRGAGRGRIEHVGSAHDEAELEALKAAPARPPRRRRPHRIADQVRTKLIEVRSMSSVRQ